MKNIKSSALIGLILFIGLILTKIITNINYKNNENNFYHFLINKYESVDKFNKYSKYYFLDENQNLVYKTNIAAEVMAIKDDNDKLKLINNIDVNLNLIIGMLAFFISSCELDLFEFYKIYYFINKDEKNNATLNIIFTSNNKFKFDKNDPIFINSTKDDLKFKKYTVIEFSDGQSFENFFSNNINIEKMKNDIRDNYNDLLKYYE